MTSYDDTKVQLTINRMTGECYENVPDKSSTELYLISQDPTSIAKIDLDAQSRTDAEISSIQSDLNGLQQDLNGLSTEVSTLSEWTTTQIDDLIGDVQEVSSQTTQNAQDIADISANLTHSTVRRWEYVDYNGLTFTAEEANSTVSMQKRGYAPEVSLEYSTGDGWNDFIVGQTTVTLPNIGDQMVLRAKTTNNTISTSLGNCNQFVMTGKVAASNSVMYLLKNDGDLDTISSTYCFNILFRDCTSLTQAPELPATTLASFCYSDMFQGCSSLTTAPELPATRLAVWCYSSMFRECTSLTQAPELPATTLKGECYYGMFRDCTSLTTPPDLSATSLAVSCYAGMFYNCSSLTQAPELPATRLANSCYRTMFTGCTSLTQAPELPATTMATDCYAFMFWNCTSLTQAPELPATTLANTCYKQMFYNCPSLNEIKIGYTGNFSGTGVPTDAFNNWVDGVSASGTFYYDGEDTTTGNSAIPTGWTVEPLTPPIQYIDYIHSYRATFDTGIVPTVDTKIEGRFRGTSEGYVIVGVGGDEVSPNYRFFNSGDSAYLDIGSGRISTAGAWDTTIWNDVSVGDYWYDVLPEGGSVIHEEGTYSSFTSYNTLKFSDAEYEWSGNYSNLDCAGFKIYEGETLVKDYRPAMDPSGVVCLYDAVSGVYEYPTVGSFAPPQDFLTFTAEEANSTWSINLDGLEYSTDGGSSWNSYSANTTMTLANVGDQMKIRTSSSRTSVGQTFALTGKIAASGSVNSLLNPVPSFVYTVENTAFYRLFKDQTALTGAPELPSPTVGGYAYMEMFKGCTALTIAPDLPATTLAEECYRNMFQDCTSLTTPPSSLPAQVLPRACYQGMFNGCSSLIATPETLGATTMSGTDAMGGMFGNCSSLTSAFSISIPYARNGAFWGCFYGCSSLQSIDMRGTASQGVGWNAFTECFYHASTLTTIYIGYTGNFGTSWFNRWVSGVSSTGTFYYNGSDGRTADWAIPSGWSIQSF